MFYKKEIINDIQKREIQEKYHAEFALALYEKISPHQNTRFTLLIDKDSPVKRIVYSGIAYDEPHKKSSTYLDVFGNHMLFNLPDNISKLYKNNSLSILESTQKIDEEKLKILFKNFNTEKYMEFKNKVDDFMILKDSGVINNKTNEDFQYKIFENSIPVVDGLLVMDTIKVYKENEQIGYLSVKYTTNSIASKLQGKDFSILNKKLDDRSFLRLINAYDLQLDDYNKDFLKEKALKRLKSDFDSFRRENNEYLNNAVVHDVYIDKKYRRQDIASQLYLKMADYMDDKNFKIKSSSVKTPEVDELWNKLFRRSPYQISWGDYKDNFCHTLHAEKSRTVKNLIKFG